MSRRGDERDRGGGRGGDDWREDGERSHPPTRGPRYSEEGQGGYRNQRRRSRSRSRSRDRDRRRSRSRSPDDRHRSRRDRSRSRSRSRDRAGHPGDRDGGKSVTTAYDKRKDSLRAVSGVVLPPPGDPSVEAVALDADLTPEEIQMMMAMGIPFGFDTTQGKKVDDEAANAGAIKVKTTRTARQYMNRKGGFNRPLPAEVTGKKVIRD